MSRAEPTVDRETTPSLVAVAALAVAAAVIGRRAAHPSAAMAGQKQKKVMAVFLAAGVVILAAWRPVASAYRDHRYDARWRQQPLGW